MVRHKLALSQWTLMHNRQALVPRELQRAFALPPPSRKPHYRNNPTNNGSCGMTAITDRPFVLVILGQTIVSMRQMRRLTHQGRGAADRGEYRQAAGTFTQIKSPTVAGAKRRGTDWSACMKNRHRVSSGGEQSLSAHDALAVNYGRLRRHDVSRPTRRSCRSCCASLSLILPLDI